MQWIVDNWLILLLGGGMVAMHLFGHGHGHGRGGHGGHGRGDPRRRNTDEHASHRHETQDGQTAIDEDEKAGQDRKSGERKA